MAAIPYLEAIRRAAMLLAFIFSATWSSAQVSAALPRELDGFVEIARLDLTDVEPRGFLREPHYPDGYAVRNISGTRGAGFKCDEKEVPLDGLPTLTAALISVEGAVFSSGDEVIFSVVIANPCARPLLLPWSPHPRDIEDDGGRYTFRMMGFGLGGETKNLIFTIDDAPQLYGTAAVPDTLRALGPKEYVVIRLRGTVRYLIPITNAANVDTVSLEGGVSVAQRSVTRDSRYEHIEGLQGWFATNTLTGPEQISVTASITR
jgi:hypothetical protein